MGAMFRHRHVPPVTLEETIIECEANRKVAHWNAIGATVLVLALPVVTWLAVSVGERGRTANCADIRRAFNDYTTELVKASHVDPNGSVPQTFRAAVQRDLAGCH